MNARHLLFVILCSGVVIDPLRSTPAPLGLLRLQDTIKPGQAAALPPGRYEVDGLVAGAAAGVSKVRKEEVDVLVLEPSREWARPLRGSGRSVSFVSFQVHASAGTIVDIGGVRLGVTLGPSKGSLQVLYDAASGGTLQWKPLNLYVNTASYGGKIFAALPTFTVRLDPATGTWDLYSGSRLLADTLPIIGTRQDQRQFSVRAGSEGAWVAGLVQADENPLYDDANANGIDDAFERQKNGRLLAADATVAERQALVREWKIVQRQKPPAALLVRRPAADAPAAVAPGR